MEGLPASRFPRSVLLQLTGDRCEALDGSRVGESAQVEFSLRGREWTSPRGEKKIFNSLDVWHIQCLGDAVDDDIPLPSEEPALDDDIPF